jgi:hypothetical protein
MHTKCCFLLHTVSCLVWVLALGGCQTMESPLAKPTGTAARPPKKQLHKFDPFPDTRIGPRVAGLRPPGYRKPVSEPARSRQQGNASDSEAAREDVPQQVRPPAK